MLDGDPLASQFATPWGIFPPAPPLLPSSPSMASTSPPTASKKPETLKIIISVAVKLGISFLAIIWLYAFSSYLAYFSKKQPFRVPLYTPHRSPHLQSISMSEFPF